MSNHSNIHPTAIIEEGAIIGEGVTVEPFAIIKKNVVIHDKAVIKSHAYIGGYTTIGEGTVVYPNAVIGMDPQARQYKEEKSYVKIGKGCQIRECVTINTALGEGEETVIGDFCFIMAYCHIAHNCHVGDYVNMANNATLAGHVLVEHHAIIGGMTPLHQHTRVGCYAMVGGMSRVPHDVPPYTIGAGIPFKFGGLNLVGLKRNGFSLETRLELTKAFKIMYRSGLTPDEALPRIADECKPLAEIEHWLQFCRDSKRGLTNLHGILGELENHKDLLEEEITA